MPELAREDVGGLQILRGPGGRFCWPRRNRKEEKGSDWWLDGVGAELASWRVTRNRKRTGKVMRAGLPPSDSERSNIYPPKKQKTIIFVTITLCKMHVMPPYSHSPRK